MQHNNFDESAMPWVAKYVQEKQGGDLATAETSLCISTEGDSFHRVVVWPPGGILPVWAARFPHAAPPANQVVGVPFSGERAGLPVPPMGNALASFILPQSIMQTVQDLVAQNAPPRARQLYEVLTPQRPCWLYFELDTLLQERVFEDNDRAHRWGRLADSARKHHFLELVSVVVVIAMAELTRYILDHNPELQSPTEVEVDVVMLSCVTAALDHHRPSVVPAHTLIWYAAVRSQVRATRRASRPSSHPQTVRAQGRANASSAAR